MVGNPPNPPCADMDALADMSRTSHGTGTVAGSGDDLPPLNPLINNNPPQANVNAATLVAADPFVDPEGAPHHAMGRAA